MLVRGRRGRFVLLVVAALAIAIIVAVIAFVSRPERIARFWATAQIQTNGVASIHEQIDYDFANNSKHGIYRIVPGLDPASNIQVSSQTAPDEIQVTDSGSDTTIRIGDPSTTITGQHRYTISYPLDTLVNGSDIGWNVHGLGWQVKAGEVEGTLVAPYELTDVTCDKGFAGSTVSCDVEHVSPGVVTVTAKNLDPHEGVTVYAKKGAVLASAPVVPAAPTDIPKRTGISPAIPAAIAFVASLLAMLLVGRMLIRAGREYVGEGGAASAAYADNAGISNRVDQSELEAMTTIEFAPPKGLTPAQGGVLLTESVNNNHKTAWMMQTAIDGYIDVDSKGKTVSLTRHPEKSGAPAIILDTMFEGTEKITLGNYNPAFASGWSSIGSELESWRKSCGFWDPKGETNSVKAAAFGGVCLIFGALATVGSAYATGASPSYNAAWLPLLAIASMVIGAGASSLIYRSELKVRTPMGSGMWLRTESFRRFLAESEAQHVERAASYGMLREYTAWAVALGEVKRWNSAMQNSSLPPKEISNNSGFYAAAPFFASAASSASTAPSSSSSGSGGGGSGGGGGGGGGGSW